MIRLSKLADYGIVAMSELARRPEHSRSAPELAELTGVPQAMTGKVLKLLARADLLTSHRGVKGGYDLARPAETISVADIIEALDGPIALTACIERAPGDCDIEASCPARTNWQRINAAIRDALDGITLSEMARTIPPAFDVAQDRAASPLN